MTTPTGTELAQGIRQKMAELTEACAGVDEATACRAPAGRWSPREILSHLWGPEGEGHRPFLEAFLQAGTPTVHIDPGNPFFTEARARVSFAQLLAGTQAEYEEIARFAAGLSPRELARQAHVPELKDSPLGERPTLAAMIGGLGEFHIQFHIDHLREILQALAE